MGDAGYLVFFVKDPVSDALADAIAGRVRTCAGAGYFDDPDAPAAERTTGGFVRVLSPDTHEAEALKDAARDVSADHGVLVEVQWREEPIAHIEAGAWRSSSTSTRAT